MNESVMYHTHAPVGGGEEYKSRALSLRCDELSASFSKGEITAAELYVQVFNAYVDMPEHMGMTMTMDQMYLNPNKAANGWSALNMYNIANRLQSLRETRENNRRMRSFGIFLSKRRSYSRVIW